MYKLALGHVVLGEKMDLSEKVDVLKRVSIFKSLTYAEFLQAAKFAEYEDYDGGVIVFEENTPADAFYIIVHGSVEILKLSEEGNTEVLATKGVGEFFGEMSIVDDLPRSASIKTKTPSRFLKISRKEFENILKMFSTVSFEVAKSVSKTVRKFNETYVSDLEERNNELEEAYKKLQKAQDDLIKSEKLSAIGKFSSLIIHDIKNPMTNIRAYGELVRIIGKDNEKLKKASDIIVSEVDRLTNMTQELLDFARGKLILDKAPVNFYSYLSNLSDMVSERLMSNNITLNMPESTDIVLMLDVEKMKRVFFNLIGNASDAIKNGGTINVKLLELDDNVEWKIQDSGIGMTDEDVQKIFEPFYTKKQHGTGLGMAIVKEIVEGHGGTITVISTKDVGTEFTIKLPKSKK